MRAVNGGRRWSTATGGARRLLPPADVEAVTQPAEASTPAPAKSKQTLW